MLQNAQNKFLLEHAFIKDLFRDIFICFHFKTYLDLKANIHIEIMLAVEFT